MSFVGGQTNLVTRLRPLGVCALPRSGLGRTSPTGSPTIEATNSSRKARVCAGQFPVSCDHSSPRDVNRLVFFPTTNFAGGVKTSGDFFVSPDLRQQFLREVSERFQVRHSVVQSDNSTRSHSWSFAPYENFCRTT